MSQKPNRSAPAKNENEYGNFTNLLDKLLSVPHSKIKAELDADCLIPSRTDTRMWHELVQDKAEVRYIRGRLKFNGHENSAPFPSAILIYRPGSLAGNGDSDVSLARSGDGRPS